MHRQLNSMKRENELVSRSESHIESAHIVHSTNMHADRFLLWHLKQSVLTLFSRPTSFSLRFPSYHIVFSVHGHRQTSLEISFLLVHRSCYFRLNLIECLVSAELGIENICIKHYIELHVVNA